MEGRRCIGREESPCREGRWSMLADGLCREGRRSIYGEEVVDTQRTDSTDEKRKQLPINLLNPPYK